MGAIHVETTVARHKDKGVPFGSGSFFADTAMRSMNGLTYEENRQAAREKAARLRAEARAEQDRLLRTPSKLSRSGRKQALALGVVRALADCIIKCKAAKKSKDAAKRLESYAEAMMRRWDAWPEPVFATDPQLRDWQAKVQAMQAVINSWPGVRIRTVVLLNACLVLAEDMRAVSKVPEWESICQTLATLTGHADPELVDEAGQEDGLKMAERLMEVVER